MWGWIVVWLLVAVLGAGWLVLLGREVVRKGARLATDLQVATERASAASTPASTPASTSTTVGTTAAAEASTAEQPRVR